MDDDEVLAGRVNDDYDDYEGQLEGYKGERRRSQTSLAVTPAVRASSRVGQAVKIPQSFS